MKHLTLVSLLLVFSIFAYAQQNDSTENLYINSADKMLRTDGNLKIGGYGEVHYNQGLDSDFKNNGSLDVHRVIMMLGYQFNSRTQFISELEFEHVKEVYVEQAFLQYKINNYINFRGGLLLVPMGIVNKYHEPVTFNGTERPLLDKYITPTTWREIGMGFSGNIFQASLRYQLYLINGFNGYDEDGAQLNGSSGLRGGRQKGAKAYASSPNYTGKVEYYGLRGLNIGLSGYFGKTQSTLYNGTDKNDSQALAAADSSVVGISMIGADFRYSRAGFQLRGQYYFADISNAQAYNEFSGSDLASAVGGYYAEVGYNVFKNLSTVNSELIPFVRYSNYDTHKRTPEIIVPNEAYNKQIITAGLGWKPAKGAIIKADLQFMKSAADESYSKVFNAGIGVMF